MDISPGTLSLFPGSYWGYPGEFWALVVCRGPPGKHVLYFPDGHTIELTDDKDIIKYRTKRSVASAATRKKHPITRAELPQTLSSVWMVPLAVPPDTDGPKDQYANMDGLLVGWDSSKRQGIVYLRPHAPKEKLDWFHIINVSESECKKDLQGWARDPTKCIARMTDFPSIRPPRIADASPSTAAARAGGGPSYKGGSLNVSQSTSLTAALKAGDVDLTSSMEAAELPWQWVGSGCGPWNPDLQGQLTQVGPAYAWQFPDPIYASGPRLLVAVSNSVFPTEEGARLGHDRCMLHFMLRYAKNLDPLAMVLEHAEQTDALWRAIGGAPRDKAVDAAYTALELLLSVVNNTLFFPPPDLPQMAIMVACVHHHFAADYTYEREMRVFAVSVNPTK